MSKKHGRSHAFIRSGLAVAIADYNKESMVCFFTTTEYSEASWLPMEGFGNRSSMLFGALKKNPFAFT